MPAPLANRFSHFSVSVNLDDWVTWAYKQQLDEAIIGFLRFRPDLLFDFDPAHNPVAFPSPRSWEFAHRAIQKFAHYPELLLGSLQAVVGDAAGIELHAFIMNLSQMPDLDAIIAGQAVEPPYETDLQYAVAAALVGRAIRAKGSTQAKIIFGNILNFAAKFRHREMGIMLVSDMHRAIGNELFTVAEFQPWAQSIGNLMLYQ
jgi:hypothetical protein